MIDCKNISITLKENGRCLVRDFSFTLHPGDKAAMIGEEGDGKSTLLKLIYDEALISSYAEWEGEVVRNGKRLAYLSQEAQELERPALELFADIDDWDALYEAAAQLRVDAALLFSERLLSTFSGGERLRLRLLRLLALRPDALLLDEPTNDADLQTLSWLEQFLCSTRLPVLYVSHDETLLERTANTIIHLEQVRRKTLPRCRVEHTGYAEYAARRAAALEKQEQTARKQREEYREKQERWQQVYNKVEHRQNTLTRQNPHAGKMLKRKIGAMKAQGRRMERETESFLEIPDVEEAIRPVFAQGISVPCGKRVLELSLDRLEAGGRVLAENLRLTVTGRERVGITGPNGCGKTTLLHWIWRELEARRDIRAGYMPQNYAEKLDDTQMPAAFLSDGTKAGLTRAYTLLGSIKYTRDEMEQPIGALSGGQKAKLLLLHLILQEYNVLVLDEPTRNLSPLSNPAVRAALRGFGGAVIAVTHDRKLLGECTAVYELTPAGLMRGKLP